MTRKLFVSALALACFAAFSGADTSDPLLSGFRNPPREARVHCYWWWLNSNTDEAAITRDLEEMKAKGYGGALLCDANGSNQFKNQAVPAGPTFGSPAWRKLYRHALQEAARLDLEISLNITSGWNLGGPTVKPEEASKILTFTRTTLEGPATIHRTLPLPPIQNKFYKDIAVLAYPLHSGPALAGTDGRQPIQRLLDKAAFKEFGWSMPVTTPLLQDVLPQPREEDTRLNEVIDVTEHMTPAGDFRWNAPEGAWEILRLGYTDSGAKVSTASGGWQGLAIDYMDHEAFETYWHRNVQPLLLDARPYIGKSLRYLVTDSWELGGANWTARFRDEFQKRRGYDPLRYLPVTAGRIVQDRNTSNRFLNDLRKTVGDLIIDEHYAVFARLAASEGLGIHPESGGPHGAPIDALRTLGVSTFPQTEFWAQSATHRSTDEDRFFVKEGASAAHTYGKKIVAAEGMTSIGPQWEETIWNDLKPTFDQAVCAGLNLILWHTFTSSPKSAGLPGQEYFAGTHLNPNVTWWNSAGPFLSYINRTQFMMQQGLPVADVVYYYGDQVPNFVQLKAADPAKVLPGYDYDVVDEHVLLHRMTVKNGRLTLPEGTSYRLLVLPQLPNISLASLWKIGALVSQGANVLGPKPERTTGLEKGGEGDAEVQKLADQLWGNCGQPGITEHAFGKGRIFCGQTTRTVLTEQKVMPDFEWSSPDPRASLDYIHRQRGTTDIYFVRNAQPHPVAAQLTVRAAHVVPEFWHTDTGLIQPASLYRETTDSRTAIPVWLEPYGSVMVVLRPGTAEHLVQLKRNGSDVVSDPVNLHRDGRGNWLLQIDTPGQYEVRTSAGATLAAEIQSGREQTQTVEGPWTVRFPPGWGAPASVEFNRLESWTTKTDNEIRHFSGTATYQKTVNIPAELLKPGRDLILDLGEVKEIARVALNGKDLGIVWKRPFTISIKDAAQAGPNELQIAVTNLWPNRLIGDQQLPPAKRRTHTNITKWRADSPLLPSGLLGPVRLSATVSALLANR